MDFSTLQIPLEAFGVSQLPTEKEPSRRVLWQDHTRDASRLVAEGNFHLACIALSLIFLSLRFLRPLATRRRREGLDVSSGQTPKWATQSTSASYAFALPHVAAAAAALSLSLELAIRTGTWKEAAALGYLFALDILRFATRDGTWRSTIYHNVNAVAFAITLLEVVQLLLPLAVIGPHEYPSTIESAKLVCLVAVLFIAFISPHPLPEKESAIEDASLAETGPVSPEQTSSWFSSYISYGWLTYLILRGFSRDLSLEDLPPLPSYDAPMLWRTRLVAARMRGGKTVHALFTVFRQNIKAIMFWAVLTAIVEYTAAFAMFNLLAYLEDPDSDRWVVHPFVWIALLFLGPMARSICYQRAIFWSTRLLVRVKVTVIQEVFQRMLWARVDSSLQIHGDKDHPYESQGPHMAEETPLDCPPGSGSTSIKTESLVSYDADAISSASDMFYAFTASAVSTAMAMTFLYQLLGWPSLLGVVVLIVLTPLPALFSKRLSRLHSHVMEATDARLSRISEYLNSIRTLKYFAWEHIVSDSINKIRLTEQQRIWKRSLTSMLVSMTGDMLSLVSLLAMFSSLVLFTDRPLRAPTAFTALAITETLRTQYVWLSKVAQWVAQGRESVQRVDRFFDSTVEKNHHPDGPPAFQNATFRLSPTSDFRLNNLSISFKEKALNVITGPTGSGKSSLLLSLLGETIHESGLATCPPDVAYVPQTAWLQNSTIRHNILFYSPYNAARYAATLHACDLDNDLSALALGDLTQVGERGSTLSGGQKQRISLARALYSSASTLLLDDVFSALDTHTTSRIWKRCFEGGMVADRTVVLVSHFSPAVADADLLVALDHGAVSFVRNEDRERREDADKGPIQHAVAFVEEAEFASTSSSSTGVASEEDVLQEMPPHPFEVSLESGEVEHHEQRASGRVPRTMIAKYMYLFGGYPAALLTVLTALLVQLAYFSITFWLSTWTTATAKDSDPAKARLYLAVYVGTVLAFVALQVVNNFNFQRGGWHAAKTMHQRLVSAVVHAPIAWFDRTPTGHIINRFGLDVQSMDSVLVDWLRMTIDNGLRFLLRLASIASIMPVFAVPAGLFCTIGFVTGELYSRAEISVKRLSAVRFSPVFSHFSDSAAGLAVIRGRAGMDATFQRILADKVGCYMRACEAQYNCNRWVSVRSDACAATIAAAAGCIAYYKSGSAGLVGFSLTNAIGLSQTILTLVRNMNELEVELNSFQRISEYAAIAPEESPEQAAALITKHGNVPASWPPSGRVEFRRVTARYAPSGPDVLRDVDFASRPGERIAVIGRTGSGKSTLALSLLRSTLVARGQVVIDGVDIAAVPLRRLRESIGLIPQEAVLFSGDVRSNLDPEGKLGEAELQAVLAACSLMQQSSGPQQVVGGNSNKSDITNLSAHTPVAAGGKNFSNGQRQILGLARAICRRSKVVIMDEATASVDQETDARMQRLIRTEFAGSTIITIAHRLRTIMDFDRVIVMGEGEILEMGSPAELIKNEGVFWDMLRNTGEFDELVALVKVDVEV
ncbi:P-loop containing nucleoside triphosphate hydrolase protein [Coniochaeta ligniaria NRRL 30616]|uniref:p-loop containing nucleoside triphosphate hydrolase protein n=1 Tax=Coniochaeta ligniaria NRRL 30616 TaxID=1408157 RepID=A0A1J7JAV9_9PEZI|nr:P-loop containing nucleoside triphosphate hydrolase protein [Coniochaeta ligniaria NRRL 30616]